MSAEERAELRQRVGAFLQQRREELGLSQGDIIKALGYVSYNSVWNLETGREGLPPKRIYAWADILQVQRDAFFRFVTGETKTMELTAQTPTGASEKLTPAEWELVASYRRLPPKYQDRLLEHAREYQQLAEAPPARPGPA